MQSIESSASLSSTVTGYEFTITNGDVTGLSWVYGSNSHALHLPSDATFSIGTDIITETIAGKSTTETVVYVPETTDTSLYQVSSDSVTVNTPSTSFGADAVYGFTFTVTNGTVTAMQETVGTTSHSHTVTLPLLPDATFTVSGSGSGSTVTESFVDGNVVDTITFVQPSASSALYAVASETQSFIAAGTATTLLSVNPYDRAEFTISSSGTVTAVETVSPSGTTHAYTPNSNTTFTQLASGYVEETVTHGSHSSYEVYAEAGSSGIYTAVAHGSGTTVDLVGLQAQLAQLPASLAALV